ncbi:hypothetical protein B0H63DRAFT_3614 [Podospora didyma]|uniref:Uncharacterized protein n=1 Tax=Podospora didyma TaxID=330526 RepID=A0AAE0U6N4_9PEZI|nr:hypothetical protein B0H63DRAFT_3614 [Podospora didyma]
MKTSADLLIHNLESIEGHVMNESSGSVAIVEVDVSRAVGNWNNVLQVAREFANKGLIVKAETSDTLDPMADNEPTLFAVHFGGQDMTTLGKLIFPGLDKIVVDTHGLPLHDPWPNVFKSLSPVYAFGSGAAEKRVFVSKSDKNLVWILTSGDIPKEPAEVTVAAAVASAPALAPALIQICAVIWGLEQITDPAIYQTLYDSAAKNERIPITNAFFDTEASDKDPWFGNVKTAAVASFNGVWKAISGRENEFMTWAF